MNKIRFWIPSIIGAILTPLFFYASNLSDNSAASHAGGGFQILLFYPIPFLTGIVLRYNPNSFSSSNQFVYVLCIGLAVIQFPLYGFILSYLKLKKGSIISILIFIIIGFHVLVSVLVLLLILISIG